MDLFIGSRSVPQNMVKHRGSYLLHNDGTGHFEDVTDKVAPAMKNPGWSPLAAADINGIKRRTDDNRRMDEPHAFSF